MRTPRRVIFINRFFRPDHSATSQVLTDLVESLAGSDYEIAVITSRQLYELPAHSLPRSENAGQHRIIRLWSTRFGRSSLRGRALDYASFLLSVGLWLLFNTRRRDIVVAKTDPPMLGVTASLVGALRGFKTVHWLQDVFPEVAFAGTLAAPRPIRAPLLAARNWALRRATATIVIGRLMAEYIRRAAKVRNVHIIHNWAPFSDLAPVPHSVNPLRKEWSLEGRFVVGYSGNMGRVHEFATLLEAAALLREDRSIVWLLIGGGAQYEWIARRVDEMGLTNVMMKPYQPRERLAQSLSVPDVHIVNLRPELEGFVVPSKFYGIAAAGRPAIFIGDRHGEIAGLIRTYRCGRNVAQGDAGQLSAMIAALRSQPAVIERLGTNALLAARGPLGRSASLNAWRELLRSLAG